MKTLSLLTLAISLVIAISTYTIPKKSISSGNISSVQDSRKNSWQKFLFRECVKGHFSCQSLDN